MKTTKQKITRLRVVSTLFKKQQARQANAVGRMAKFSAEMEKIIRSIPKKDCELYAEKIARHACVS